MTFYSAFAWQGFWNRSFQIARNQEQITTGGGKEERQAYVTPYQKLQLDEEQREKVRKAKTDLDRLESVLRETDRQKRLAAESAKIARERNALKRAIELEAAENEYLNEINRLLMVRAELVARVRHEEGLLVIMIMAMKRRLRITVQPASRKYLH